MDDVKANALKRLEVMREMEQENQRSKKEQAKQVEEQERKQKQLEAEQRMEQELTAHGMKELIPFYVKQEKDANNSIWNLFQIPGYCILYVRIIMKAKNCPVEIKFKDAEGRVSPTYLTLSEALVDAKI